MDPLGPASLPGAMTSTNNKMSRMAVLAMTIIAVGLPPAWTASALVGADSPLHADVVAGIWIFKATLLLHAAVVWILPRFRHTTDTGSPLLPGQAEQDERAEIPLLLGILVAAVILRAIQLNAGMWFDELQTLVTYVRLPLPEIVATFDSQNQHLLYSVSAWLSTTLLGEAAWSLRLPALLFGVASVGAAYWFGTLVTGRREALLAAAMLAFSYHHVWFSQNARGYTGLLLWTLVGSGLFVQLLRRTESRGWGLPIAYAAAMTMAMYTHATAAVVVAAHLLIGSFLAVRARKAPWPVLIGIGLTVTFTLQLYAVVLPQLVHTLTAPNNAGVTVVWQNPVWLVRETLSGLAAGVPGGMVGVAAGLAVVTVGAISYGKRSLGLLALLTVPAVITMLVIIGLGHNLWPRFFFFSAGFATLIAVRGVFVLFRLIRVPHPREIAAAATALVVLASATTLPGAWGPKQDYGGAGAFVDEQRSAGDAVVVVDMTRLPYNEYEERGWLEPAGVAELAALEDRHQRTWLLYTFPTRLAAIDPDTWDRVRTRFSRAAEFPGSVRGGEVVVMVRER
jgi:hypothetical protein